MIKKTVLTDLICLECGSITTISRRESRQRELYHRKHIYCPKCQTVTGQIELKDKALIKVMLEFKPRRNELEETIYNLLSSENQGVKTR